ncbi:MAG: ATP-binding cassette domain-containing protein [Alphaproteobacteria bacterium]|nr:ATP-binding cassette domain-containing protein [Alphaproteobacteria bacterium]
MPGRLLLSVQDAYIAFGSKPLFQGLSFNITEGDKICLVGKNGTGKTTLMNIIQGYTELDDGIRWQLEGTTIGYLQQEVTVVPGQSVFDFVFAQLSGEERESQSYKVDMVVQPLGLSIDDRMDRLSGGQVRRAAIARAVVEDPDILLMDEPTNHLDLDIIEWLEDYLKSWRGTLIIISHDKTFLSNVSDRVFWLDRGKLRVCPRGFKYFDEWSLQILEIEEKELLAREKKLEQEVAWASRGVKARLKRNVSRLDRMEDERAKLKRDRNSFNRMMAKIEMPPAEYEELSSKIVAEFFKVGKVFNDHGTERIILDKFNLRIMRGDRIGVLGLNGSGKTSFLRLLVGELQPDSGKVKISPAVEFSYFDQKRQDLEPEFSLWRNLCPDGDHIDVRGKNRHVIGYLKDFLFDADMAHQPVKTLSGGQKNRLMLAKILAHPKNFLILDEPTNDLDMETLDMLEEILAEYEGTLIIVSHDRDFLDQTVTKILAFEGNGQVEGYIGGYSDYLAARKPKPDVAAGAVKAEKIALPEVVVKVAAPLKKLSYKLQFELDHLPQKISSLEVEINLLEDQLSDAALYSRDPVTFQNTSRRLGVARDELEEAETRWLELEEMRANIKG